MTGKADDYERAAAGMDFDGGGFRERAAALGSALAENGPEGLLDEIENLIPENVREQIRNFPIAAVIAGVGIGLWLGMKKGNEVLAAGASMVSAAVVANVSQVFPQGGSD